MRPMHSTRMGDEDDEGDQNKGEPIATDALLRKLRAESLLSGEMVRMRLCEMALAGDVAARIACSAIINALPASWRQS